MIGCLNSVLRRIGNISAINKAWKWTTTRYARHVPSSGRIKKNRYIQLQLNQGPLNLNNEVLKHSCYQPRNCHNDIKVEVLPACQSYEFKLKPIAIRVLTIRTVLDIFIFCISSLTMYNCLCSKYTNYANLLKYFYNNDDVLQLNIFITYKFGSTFS